MKNFLNNFFILVTLSSFIGASFIGFDFLNISISPFRVLIFLALLILITKFKLHIHNLDKFLFFWFLYSIIQLPFVLDPEASIRTSLIILIVLIFSILESNSSYDKQLLSKFIFLVGFLNLLLGLNEILTGLYIIENPEKNIVGLREGSSIILQFIGLKPPITFFFNENNYCLFIFMILPYIHKFSFYIKRGNFLFLLYIVVSFFSMFIAQSRLSIICLILYLIFFYALKSKKSIIRFSFIFVSMILTTSIYWIKIFTNIEHSDQIRLNLFKNGMNYLYESFFLGIGLGNFEFWEKRFSLYETGNIINSHSFWLEILTCSGILVFILILYLFIETFILGLRELNKSKFKNNELRVFVASFIPVIISINGPSSIFNSEVTLILLFLLIKSIYYESFKSNKRTAF